MLERRQQPDGTPLEPVLLSRHLEFALPYPGHCSPRASVGTCAASDRRDVAVLIVRPAPDRLHVGDASLSNILFRRDAESFSAYLVDAETGVSCTRS